MKERERVTGREAWRERERERLSGSDRIYSTKYEADSVVCLFVNLML